MDVRQSAFLNILRASLAGTPAALEAQLSPEDWQALARMAAAHHVQALCYEAVHHIPAAREALGQMGTAVRRQVVEQMLRTQRLLEVSSHLQQAGLKAIVVKGIVCRSLYPKPDHRPSSDEDLLIKGEQFTACGAALNACGMTTADPENAFERTFRSPETPLRIELHQALFDPAAPAYGHWNDFFADVFDRAEEIDIQGQKLLTMAPTDHMLYLMLHAFKHFLHSGFGIRQVCDMVLYANTYGPVLNWEKLLEGCQAVHGQLFAAAIFRIGERYLGFDPQQACYPAAWQTLQVDEAPLLEDLLQAGVYGGATDSRKRSSNVTLAAAANQKSSPLKSALFPPVSSLSGTYPYLNKHPWLLPWAWLCRIVTYQRGHHKDAQQALTIGNQRLELLRQYGVIEKQE